MVFELTKKKNGYPSKSFDSRKCCESKGKWKHLKKIEKKPQVEEIDLSNIGHYLDQSAAIPRNKKIKVKLEPINQPPIKNKEKESQGTSISSSQKKL